MLSAGAIKKYLFCKRSFYYEFIENYYKDNEYTLKGKEYHRNVDTKQKIVKNNVVQYTKVYLESKTLNINTVADMIEESQGKIYPVEYKSGKADTIRFAHMIQLTIEALLLEETKNIKVDFGYLYYADSQKRVKVSFTEKLRKKTIEIIKEVQNFLKNPFLPPVESNIHKCMKCSLLDYCMPYESKYVLSKTKKSKIIPPIDSGEYLYIFNSSLDIHLRNENLFVKDKNNKSLKIPINKVKQVILVGNASLTTPSIKNLLSKNIPIIFTSFNGKYLGRITPPLSKNSILRLAQFRAHDDKLKKLYLAKRIVSAKIQNMKTFLARYNRTNKFDFSKTIEAFNFLKKNVSSAKDVDTLRGLEGFASQKYFSALESIVNKENFSFDRRNRRPPQDPINSLLSYGYTLLYKEIINSLSIVGLDPYMGFIHTDKYGKPSLALDIMEEFRTPIIDSLVITLIRKKVLSPNDFIQELGYCKIKVFAKKKFIEHYSSLLSREIKHPIFGYYVSYSRIFLIQARILAKFLKGEYKHYYPFRMR